MVGALMIVTFLVIDIVFFKAFQDLIKGLKPSKKRIFIFIYWAIPVLLFGAHLYSTFASTPTLFTKSVRTIAMLIYTSKGLGAFTFLVGNGFNIFRKTAKKVIQPESKEKIITRSEFISKTSAGVGMAQFGLLSFGILSGAYDYRVRKINLPIKGLPKQFDGMTICQISDIHSGSFYNKTAVNGGVDMLLAEKPDVVFFTGDLVNDKSSELNAYFDTFKRIKAPLGVFSTLGNHDYGDYVRWNSQKDKDKNLADLIEGHKLMGWDLLMDENRAITLNGESLGILGIQNWGVGRFIKKGDLNKALQNTQDFSTKLLLSHDPSHWREQVLNHTDIDVAFAGHTHGMQFGVDLPGFRWSPIQYKYKEWAGLYEENNQKLYVNRGYGFLGYPGRVGILPEISIFTLQSV